MRRGAIALCLALLAGSGPGFGSQPPGPLTWCAGSGACYSAHVAELPFGGAQEACAGRGGVLSPASEEAEVRAILELLRALAAEPGSWLFWLGLQRAAQRCTQPHLPLRGFSWTAGPQPAPREEPIRWLKEPGLSCTTQRCAALRLTAGQPALEPWGWEERGCQSSARGYVCKYRYDGACPAPRPRGARSLLYALPYGLHSAALPFSPPGTQLRVACPAPRGDVRLLCRRAPGGYSWHQQRPGACAGAADCIGQQGAFLCECPPGLLPGADGEACVPPPAGTAPSSRAIAPSAAPTARSSPAAEVLASTSASTGFVVLLVTMAGVTVVILVLVMLGLFKICFPSGPAPPSPACKLEATRGSSSSEAESKAAGAEPEEIAPGQPKPEGEEPAGN